MPHNVPVVFKGDPTQPADTIIPVVTITVGDTGLGDGTSPFSIEAENEPYWGFGITLGYYWDYGVRGAPVAAPYPSRAAFWRAHGGFCYKVCTWAASRLNQQPASPSVAAANPNDVPYSRAVCPASSDVLIDGDRLYSVVGRIVWLMQFPPADSDPIYAAASPIDIAGVAANILNPSDFVQYLIGPVPPPAGFQGGPIQF